ncbi:hypothetical protein SLS62_001607 [Diatrype stigma]|uniref:Microbial-type PARG catalytic domain-containing protein n=1 Tax=Diatrype stigma TaxID=117547 RepID=A0AAN9YT97_9PEZI
MSRTPRHANRKATLTEVARETQTVLPGILQQLPHLHARRSQVYSPDDLPALDVSSRAMRFELVSSPPPPPSASPSHRPRTYGTRIKVLNLDSLDAAIMMADSLGAQQPQQPSTSTAATTTTTTTTDISQRVAVMNLASDVRPGGGWLTGAVAQEEALCYRSSLAMSLRRRYYPLAPLAVIYTRDVLVIRSSMTEGHRLLLSPSPTPTTATATATATATTSTTTTPTNTNTTTTTAASLPVVSVVSVAAIKKPALRTVTASALGSGSGDREERAVYRDAADRDLTKEKMRQALRAAARGGHELLVLAALGCGVFRNPPAEVARCWLEVLDGEAEFAGGRWFREIWFAVLDRRAEAGGNFDVFERVLGDREVGKVVV